MTIRLLFDTADQAFTFAEYCDSLGLITQRLGDLVVVRLPITI